VLAYEAQVCILMGGGAEDRRESSGTKYACNIEGKIYAIHSMQIYEITPRDSMSSLSGRPGTADTVHERNGKTRERT